MMTGPGLLWAFFSISALMIGGHLISGEESCTGTTVSGPADVDCQCSCECEAEECPGEMLSCSAGFTVTQVMDSDGLQFDASDLHTFDGEKMQLFSANKFLVARSTAPFDQEHPCKFQAHVVTKVDRKTDKRYIKWLGVGFDEHEKNSDKYDRNLRISIQQDHMEIRGRGLSEPDAVTDFPYEYVDSQNEVTLTANKVTRDDTLVYTVAGGAVHHACRWQIVFTEHQDGHDTVVVSVSQDYVGLVEGFCGDADGDGANDWYGCMDQSIPENLQSQDNAGRSAVSESCVEGAKRNP